MGKKTMKDNRGSFPKKPSSSGHSQEPAEGGSSSKIASFFVEPQTQNEPSQSGHNQKRPFDKKRWRMQKYNRKFRLQQWEEKRRKAVTREYNRTIRSDDGDDAKKFDVKRIYEEAEEEQAEGGHEEKQAEREHEEGTKGKKKKNWRYADKLEAIEDEKLSRQEEFLRRKAEKEEAIKRYKKEKARKLRLLNRKTKKGQPVMAGRMQLLYEEIKKQLGKE